MKRAKTVIITGSNSGIGLAAAVMFAEQGHNVVLACRNLGLSTMARDAVIKATGNRNVKLMKVDMSSFSSIKVFCSEFKAMYSKLDILINNAAYVEHGAPHRVSEDGLELTFATNVFGPYLMTSLLRSHLKASDDPRVLNASSNIIKHFFDPKKKIDTSLVRAPWPADKRFTVYDRYRDSKMALVMLTFRMAEEYEEDGIKINSIHINGAKLSKSTLNKFTLKWRMIGRIQNTFLPPVANMAENYIRICTSDLFRHVTGKLINDELTVMKPAPYNPDIKMQFKQLTGRTFYPYYADNKNMQEKILRLCREVTGV